MNLFDDFLRSCAEECVNGSSGEIYGEKPRPCEKCADVGLPYCLQLPTCGDFDAASEHLRTRE